MVGNGASWLLDQRVSARGPRVLCGKFLGGHSTDTLPVSGRYSAESRVLGDWDGKGGRRRPGGVAGRRATLHSSAPFWSMNGSAPVNT